MAATYLLVSYIILAVFAVILMCSGPTEALIAFGKNPSTSRDDQNKTKPQKPRLKVCNDNSECKVDNTRCMLDHIEGKKHCACPDGSQPDNGACKLKGLAPGEDCSTNKCAPGSYCSVNTSLNRKICVCEEGFNDDNSHKGFRFCNGASYSLIPHAPSLLAGFVIFGVIRSLLQSH